AVNASLAKTVIAPPNRWIDLDLAEVWQHAELLYFLVWRDIKVRYKQTALGVGWVVLQPLLGAIIFTIIFGEFARMPSDGMPYPVFVYAGLVPWTFFATAMTRSTGSLVTDADLIAKIYFPRLILPLTAILSSLIDFVSGLAIVLLMIWWYGLQPSAAIL